MGQEGRLKDGGGCPAPGRADGGGSRPAEGAGRVHRAVGAPLQLGHLSAQLPPQKVPSRQHPASTGFSMKESTPQNIVWGSCRAARAGVRARGWASPPLQTLPFKAVEAWGLVAPGPQPQGPPAGSRPQTACPALHTRRARESGSGGGSHRPHRRGGSHGRSRCCRVIAGLCLAGRWSAGPALSSGLSSAGAWRWSAASVQLRPAGSARGGSSGPEPSKRL